MIVQTVKAIEEGVEEEKCEIEDAKNIKGWRGCIKCTAAR